MHKARFFKNGRSSYSSNSHCVTSMIGITTYYGAADMVAVIEVLVQLHHGTALHEGIARVHAVGRQLLTFCMILFYHYIVSLSFL